MTHTRLIREDELKFTLGERVWWRTAKTPNMPVAEVHYETIRSEMRGFDGKHIGWSFEDYDGKHGARFGLPLGEDSVWMPDDKIHHIWEPIS